MPRELIRVLRDLIRTQLRSASRRKTSNPLLIVILVVALLGLNYCWQREQRLAPLPGRGTTYAACKINSVADGDTVNANCGDGLLKVRVYGIDAPELGQKPWGAQSQALLEQLLTRSVKLEVVDTDRYGRVVARLYDGNRDLGLEMVRQGGAAVYEAYNDSPAYEYAQQEAKQAKRGIWSRRGGQQEPWEWRRLNPR